MVGRFVASLLLFVFDTLRKKKASSTDKARSRHHPRRQRRVPRVVGGFVECSLASFCFCLFLTLSAMFHLIRWQNGLEQTQPPVMDVSARTTMKDAAKCDKRCELQDSVNQQEVEHMLLFRVFMGGMFASVLFDYLRGVSLRLHASVFSCFKEASVTLMHVCQSCLACATFEHLLRKRCYV